jgi:hypothetical protein
VEEVTRGPGSGVRGPGSGSYLGTLMPPEVVADPGSRIPDPGSRIPDYRLFHSHSSAPGNVCCFTARSQCPAFRTNRNWYG